MKNCSGELFNVVPRCKYLCPSSESLQTNSYKPVDEYLSVKESIIRLLNYLCLQECNIEFKGTGGPLSLAACVPHGFVSEKVCEFTKLQSAVAETLSEPPNRGDASTECKPFCVTW